MASIRQHLDRAFVESGAAPAGAIEARDISAVAGLVAAGLGVSAVPGLVLSLVGSPAWSTVHSATHAWHGASL